MAFADWTDFTSEFMSTFCPENEATVRGHLSISLPYLLYSLLSPPTLSTPTPLCAYVHIITKGRQPPFPIVNDFAY
jgi:hypothetical protein